MSDDELMENICDMIITAFLTILLHNNSKESIRTAKSQVARFIKNADRNTKEKIHPLKSSPDFARHIELIYNELFTFETQPWGQARTRPASGVVTWNNTGNTIGNSF